MTSSPPATPLAELAGQLLDLGLNYLIHSTLLVLVSGAIVLANRLSKSADPRLEESLWRFALIGALLTVPAQALLGTAGQLSIPGPGVTSERSAWASVPASVDRSAPVVSTSSTVQPTIASQGKLSSPRPRPEPRSTPASKAPALTATQLSVIWLLVALGLATRTVIATVRLRAHVRTLPEVMSARALEMLGRLSKRAELRSSPRLLEDDASSSPFVVGGHPPLLVLPKRAFGELGARELLAVMAHEVAHLARRDPAVASRRPHPVDDLLVPATRLAARSTAHHDLRTRL